MGRRNRRPLRRRAGQRRSAGSRSVRSAAVWAGGPRGRSAPSRRRTPGPRPWLLAVNEATGGGRGVTLTASRRGEPLSAFIGCGHPITISHYQLLSVPATISVSCYQPPADGLSTSMASGRPHRPAEYARVSPPGVWKEKSAAPPNRFKQNNSYREGKTRIVSCRCSQRIELEYSVNKELVHWSKSGESLLSFVFVIM